MAAFELAVAERARLRFDLYERQFFVRTFCADIRKTTGHLCFQLRPIRDKRYFPDLEMEAQAIELRLVLDGEPVDTGLVPWLHAAPRDWVPVVARPTPPRDFLLFGEANQDALCVVYWEGDFLDSIDATGKTTVHLRPEQLTMDYDAAPPRQPIWIVIPRL